MFSRIFLVLLSITAISLPAVAARRVAHKLCTSPNYECIKVKKGDSWQKLWPDPRVRRIVMRLNRMNTNLVRGMRIVVPVSLNNITHMDISPMPYSVHPYGQRVVVVNMSEQAFGAYDSNGYLVHWGPISGGKGFCHDIQKRCNTPRGSYRVFRKGTEMCESKKFPVPDGGAPMPYCMYFKGGFAMHAGDLPGYHASHGCVRMFYEDAEWLNKHFLNKGKGGTKVIVQ
ncbi:MAG: L,D-transpeptidase [Gammaproteobacteria bacterium]|nr:L,D-transpeptidase [Gammaproteobacteria bacterium]